MTTLAITLQKTGEAPAFCVTSIGGIAFVLNSVLIVDATGVPVWEFIRDTYETSDDVEISTQIIDVMTESFREALQSASNDDVVRTRDRAATVHDICYGRVPPGYTQSFPEKGVPLLAPGQYRVVVFSSLGGANLLFHWLADE